MTWMPTEEPRCEGAKERAIELIVEGRAVELAGMPVRRVLPTRARRMVGPFVFLDHMGPVEFPAGHGLDVAPHPHIGLSTVTYLFEGEIFHRDSLGTALPIRPGAVNWMTAGRGIVHSERTPPELRAAPHALNGIQLWVALPEADEAMEPSFVHHPASDFPPVSLGGAELRVLAGEAYGVTSPVAVRSPMFYVDAILAPGGHLPMPDDYEERSVYVASGEIACGEGRFGVGTMLVFARGEHAAITSERGARVMLLGGAPLGPRHITWNFVSSQKETIERAVRDWREDRFPRVPGDELERVPMP